MADETTNSAEMSQEEVQAAPAAETPVEAHPIDAMSIVPGMVVRVHQKVKETNTKGEDRERIQIFEGTVIAKKGQDKASATITVRKIASGVGVERIFPLRMPSIASVEVVRQYDIRRSKLYYLRDYKKRLKEKALPAGLAAAAPKGKKAKIKK
jgi:large subunit ribosomal protein L19